MYEKYFWTTLKTARLLGQTLKLIIFNGSNDVDQILSVSLTKWDPHLHFSYSYLSNLIKLHKPTIIIVSITNFIQGIFVYFSNSMLAIRDSWDVKLIKEDSDT